MKKFAAKHINILCLYWLFVAWMPFFWFASAVKDRHKMVQLDWLSLNWGEMFVGTVVLLGCLISQSLLFFIKVDKAEE